MEFEDLRREDTESGIYPNAGRRQVIIWTRADAQRFVELLRAAFPNLFLYESFGWRNSRVEKPDVRILDRVDDPTITQNVQGFFPYPEWKPELVRVGDGVPGERPHWTWARYLSPRFSFEIPRDDCPWKPEWRQENRARPFESWPRSNILTSYRRQFPDEQRIEAKIMRLARKLCIRTVPVQWKTVDDYFAGRGRVARVGFMVGDGWATPAAVDWYRSAPNRILDGSTWASGGGHGCLPVEDVPDSWWGNVPKPKWAQR